MFLFSPPVLFDLFEANINWLIILGFLLPPRIGLFLVLLKPQMGIAVALYWFIETWHQHGIKEVLKIFAPVSIAFIVSFLIYGFWPLNTTSILDVGWNTSLWPLSLPIGMVLFAIALRTRQVKLAYMVSPFISPYVAGHSWSVAIFGLMPNLEYIVISVIGFWLALIIGAFS